MDVPVQQFSGCTEGAPLPEPFPCFQRP